MDFSLSDEQREIGRSLRRFAERELQPRAREFDNYDSFPWDVWRAMAALGLFGFRIDPAYGGLMSDFLSMGIATEEIGRGSFGCTGGIQLAGIAGEILGRYGDDAVKAEWLPKVVQGEAVVAVALTEPGAGSDAGNLACRVRRDGADTILDGEKSGITFGVEAAATIVIARGEDGISSFLVPMDAPGVSRAAIDDMGCRLMRRGVMNFDSVRLPANHRIGDAGAGFRQVMRSFDFNRIIIALGCLGVAAASHDETLDYVRERQAFGRPLARFEGISFPIAEQATYLEAARWLCYRGLWLADRGEPHTKEAAMAKWWVPKLSAEAIKQCLLFHGHYGYTLDLPFEQRLRDVIGFEIGDGTAEVSKIVVSRELLGREFLPY